MATRLPTLPVLRGTLLVAACLAGGRGVWALTRDPLLAVAASVDGRGPRALTTLPFADLLAAACAAALLGCTAWLLVTTVLAVAARLAAALVPESRAVGGLERLATRACPAAARVVVTATLGLAVGAAAPAHADPAGGPTGTHGPTGLTGLALPDRTTGGAAHASAARTVPSHPTAVVVRRGDSLWSIATDLLPAGADAPDVTEAWHRLHRANTTRIGADPDLILPGTRLVVPGQLAPHREERS